MDQQELPKEVALRVTENADALYRCLLSIIELIEMDDEACTPGTSLFSDMLVTKDLLEHIKSGDPTKSASAYWPDRFRKLGMDGDTEDMIKQRGVLLDTTQELYMMAHTLEDVAYNSTGGALRESFSFAEKLSKVMGELSSVYIDDVPEYAKGLYEDTKEPNQL